MDCAQVRHGVEGRDGGCGCGGGYKLVNESGSGNGGGFRCEVDCGNMPYTKGQDDNGKCKCDGGYRWD